MYFNTKAGVHMNDKKRMLITSGMKLFATQGYHRTSIQEIATKAGISKGAFYLYFQSKEEFVVKALQFFYFEIKKKMADVNMEELPPQESLAKQINTMMEYIYEHRYIITMHLQADLSLGEDAVEFFRRVRVDNFLWLKENLLAIYGAEINDYLFDLIAQFEGLMSGIYQWVILDETPVKKDRTGPYLVDRLDEMVKTMLKRKAEPLFLMDDLPEKYQTLVHQYTVEEQLKEILKGMEETITQIDLPSEKKSELHKVVKIVLQKVKKKEHQTIVIQGLLVHFNQVPDLREQCQAIADLLQIELLE